MRLMPLMAASALLLAAACTDQYGQVDYGRTALLGVGVGAAAALAIGAASDKPRPYYGGSRGGYGGRGYRQPPPPPPGYGRGGYRGDYGRSGGGW